VTEERSNSPKNVIVMLLMLAAAFVLNPLVKLKDWLKGERE
jgi:hypothetical protein